jgi:polar amino acid transport system permease protein
MFADLDPTPLLEGWRYLAAGLGLTLMLSALTIVSSLALGAAIGFARIYGPDWVSRLLTFYIDSMRAIPVLVVLVWMYFAFPLVAGISLPPFWAAWAALTLHIAAYVAEILRAGIKSIRPGQVRAALALGLSGVQVVGKVVLPQAVIRMLPALASIVSITIKDTAIAATIAVPEYMQRSQTLAGQSFRPVEVFTTAMVVYFLILFPTTRAIDSLYRRVAHLGRS